MKLNEKDFIKQANKIYINPTKEVLFFLQKKYEEIYYLLEHLKKIDISNVEPLSRIAPPIKILREDNISQDIYLEKRIILENAKKKNDNFVVMKRIIK